VAKLFAGIFLSFNLTVCLTMRVTASRTIGTGLETACDFGLALALGMTFFL
jgi:hypothetical protein